MRGGEDGEGRPRGGEREVRGEGICMRLLARHGALGTARSARRPRRCGRGGEWLWNGLWKELWRGLWKEAVEMAVEVAGLRAPPSSREPLLIRGNQRQSEAIRGNQHLPAASRSFGDVGVQRAKVVHALCWLELQPHCPDAAGRWKQSEEPSEAVGSRRKQLDAVGCKKKAPEAIRSHKRS